MVLRAGVDIVAKSLFTQIQILTSINVTDKNALPGILVNLHTQAPSTC